MRNSTILKLGRGEAKPGTGRVGIAYRSRAFSFFQRDLPFLCPLHNFHHFLNTFLKSPGHPDTNDGIDACSTGFSDCPPTFAYPLTSLPAGAILLADPGRMFPGKSEQFIGGLCIAMHEAALLHSR